MPNEDEYLPRETGSEKSGRFCSSCGEELPAVTSPYGSVRTGACPVCSAPGPSVDLLQAQVAASLVDPPADDPDDEDD